MLDIVRKITLARNRRFYLITWALGGAALCGSLLITGAKPKAAPQLFTFVLGETPLPDSLDPLEADYSNNLHASQMVHRTLLDIDHQNGLSSSVLQRFTYKPEAAEIEFEVGDEATFSDGSRITSRDVEMTLLRMAARRPEFPVLRHIRGIKEWSRRKEPLSSSLSGVVVEGKLIRIVFEQNINNPLFRFALPLFGVVKHECVDLSKNKLEPTCPTSGFYEVEARDHQTIVFRLTNVQPRPSGLPARIQIKYYPHTLSAANFEDMNSGSYVVLEQEYGNEGGSARSGFARMEQPNSRFSVFQLNPTVEPFQNAQLRRYFANLLRSSLQSGESPIQGEASVLSRILPGFMTSEELMNSVQVFDASKQERFRKLLKGKKIRWMKSPNNNNDAFELALQRTAAELGMALETEIDRGGSRRFEGFVSGEFGLLLAGSGFWAFDPVGDLQMLFTKGLHKPLKFVTDDRHLQNLLRGLEFDDDPNDRLRKVNIYLYEQGLFNVYAHSKRVYWVKGINVSRDIPVAITPPAPWQVFNADQE